MLIIFNAKIIDLERGRKDEDPIPISYRKGTEFLKIFLSVIKI